MKLTGTALVVTLTFLALSLQPLIVTSVVTSYEKLRELVAGGEGALLKGIEDEINVRQEHIKNLSSILMQHFQSPKQDYQFQADHPNDFYLLVKHHVVAWYDSGVQEELFPVLEEVIKKLNISFPSLDDFGDATLALVRLQYVYKLKAQDMFEGNYLGYMGPSLDTEDAYLVGKQAFTAGHAPEAKEWLQMHADLVRQAMENMTESASEEEQALREEYVWTLALLGRTHLYLNETEMARKLYDQCSNSGLTDIEEMEELNKELEADNLTKMLEEYAGSVDEIDENVTALCSREKHHRIPALRPYHVCRYKSDPFIPYRRFREEILSTAPFASVFYDVIHDEEIEKLKNISKTTGLKRGLIVGNSGGEQSDVRTGDVGWVDDSEDPLVARVSQRVTAFTRLDVTRRDRKRQSSEAMQVVNYGLGGHYTYHLDALDTNGEQDRLATCLFYLSDVEKGGATIFPRIGLSVAPIKGMALVWYNYPPHMAKEDYNTLHAGCPVLMGNKWIANKWIWTYGNTFRRPCGPTSESQQPEVEKITSLDAVREIIE